MVTALGSLCPSPALLPSFPSASPCFPAEECLAFAAAPEGTITPTTGPGGHSEQLDAKGETGGNRLETVALFKRVRGHRTWTALTP